MRTQVSTVALIAALLSASPAFAQLSLGGGGGGLDLGVNLGGDNGVNVDVGVGLGGQSGLGVDVDAGVGGDNGLGVGVDAGVGSNGVGVDAGVGLGGNEVVGVDVNAEPTNTGSGNLIDVGVGTGGGSTGPNGGHLIDIAVTPDRDPVPDLHISALDEALRVDALIDLIADPQLAGVDIDAVIDDRRVSILPVGSLLDSVGLGQIVETLSTGEDGRLQLLDAIGDSAVLTSILGNEGIVPEEVLAVRINDNGNTEVIVLGGAVALADLGGATLPGSGAGGSVLDGLTVGELAALDIDLLSDEDLARIDLTLLPNEDQRLDAVVRLLSNADAGGGSVGGPIQLVDLSAILGPQALGQLGDLVAGTGATGGIDAEIVAQLVALGIDPEAIVAIGTADDGSDRIFVDTSLALAGFGALSPTGATPTVPSGSGLLDPLLGLSSEELAELDIDLLTDEELALVDLSLLPNQEQRLDAVIRLLGTGQPASGSDISEIRLIDLQALLGDQGLADISAVLTNEDATGTALVLDADLLDILEEAGIAPEAVAAIRLGDDGQLQVFLDADLGTELAAIDTTVTIGGSGITTPGTGTDGGTGEGEGTGPDTGGGAGTDTGGGSGTGGDSGTGNGSGTNGGGNTGNGGGGTATGGGPTGGGSGANGTSGGSSTGNGSGGSGPTGGNGTTGKPSTGGNVGVGAGGAVPNPTLIASATGAMTAAQLGLVADLDCAAGVSALAEGSVASPEVIVEARRLELVRVIGCAQPLTATEVDQLREAISANVPLSNTLGNAGVNVEEVIGATVSGDIITVYLDRPIA